MNNTNNPINPITLKALKEPANLARRELGESPQVAIGLSDPIVTDEEAIEAFRGQGLVTLSIGQVVGLRKVGVFASQVGVTKLQRGRAMVTQERLDEMMKLVGLEARRLSEADARNKSRVQNLVRLAEAMSSLVGKMNESIALTSRMEGGRQIHDEVIPSPEPTAKSFGANQVIKPGTAIVTREVNFYAGEAPAKPAEK